MRNIWVKCSACGVIFDREEGRRVKGIICPQCRTRLSEERLIRSECSLCGRMTLTKNGVCPWCDVEEEYEEKPKEEAVSLAEEVVSSEKTCSVRYQTGNGIVILKLSYQSREKVPVWEKIVKEAAKETIRDVLYNCVTERERRQLLERQESRKELTRMIREAVWEELEPYPEIMGQVDIATLQVSDLEVSTYA